MRIIFGKIIVVSLSIFYLGCSSDSNKKEKVFRGESDKPLVVISQDSLKKKEYLDSISTITYRLQERKKNYEDSIRTKEYRDSVRKFILIPLNKAVCKYPGSTSLRYKKALALFEIGEDTKGFDELDSVIEIDPYFVEAYRAKSYRYLLASSQIPADDLGWGAKADSIEKLISKKKK